MSRPKRVAKLLFLVFLVLVLLAAGGTARVFALEVWTPQSGEVELEELPRDTPEARFKHACALVAAGQSESAIPLLRALIEQHPGAEFAERARYTIGLALFSSGKYQEAFDELEGFLERYPDSGLEMDVRELQLEAARNEARSDLEGGLDMLDRLAAAARSDALAARYQKEKADLLLREGRYLWAKEEYFVLVDRYPRSALVPYCFLKVAECDLQLGRWLARGDEYLKKARRTLEEFVAVYREHELKEEAERKLSDAIVLEAEQNKRIALFYIERKKRPVAAVNYLFYIMGEFPGTEQARWAAETLEGILQVERTPLRGRFQKMELPGVAPAREPESEGTD